MCSFGRSVCWAGYPECSKWFHVFRHAYLLRVNWCHFTSSFAKQVKYETFPNDRRSEKESPRMTGIHHVHHRVPENLSVSWDFGPVFVMFIQSTNVRSCMNKTTSTFAVPPTIVATWTSVFSTRGMKVMSDDARRRTSALVKDFCQIFCILQVHLLPAVCRDLGVWKR